MSPPFRTITSIARPLHNVRIRHRDDGGRVAVTAAQAPPSEAHGQSVRADSYYAAGDRIEITAPMGGDVIVAGRQIDIVQPVSGDILAAGWRVVLSAQADDDVRIAAAEVALNAPINHRGRARAGEGGERDSALR